MSPSKSPKGNGGDDSSSKGKERMKLVQPDDDQEDVGEFQPNNSYARKKTVAKGCLNITLLMANFSQLKALVSLPDKLRTGLYIHLMVMIGLSVCLQVAVSIVLLWLAASNPHTRKGHRRVELLNNVSVALILIVTVINLFISSVGITQ